MELLLKHNAGNLTVDTGSTRFPPRRAACVDKPPVPGYTVAREIQGKEGFVCPFLL